MSRPRSDPARPASGRGGLELWGGLECTVARIGDAWRDQFAETGHRDRADDLDRVAALGIRTLRYPVLWETVSPDGRTADWRWHDARMERLRALGIRPIVGLVHHGSGPAGTHLLDDGFPEKLAVHAAAVARRYPWVDLFTPVNEPLTTARFSALYGHWYPHHRDPASFLRATLVQCRATLAAMRAIREVTPHAALVQTEDIGRTFSTPPLAYQAAHENERRWLSLDLLCGRVDRQHPLYGYMARLGVADADLRDLRTRDAEPGIVGVNHYLTSERHLDHRVDRFDPRFHGGNGRDVYADVEAVRVDLPPDSVGPRARLAEVVERHGLPVAVTEVHHGCTREEQLRWLVEVWDAAEGLRSEGADIRAVTMWSLFGARDWNSLLVRRDGFYEPGAFDVRFDPPRPTALAAAARDLAAGRRHGHPTLDRYGWWHQEQRLYHPPGTHLRRRGVERPRPLLVLAAEGALGRALRHICRVRGLDAVFAAPGTTAGDVGDLVRRHRPWAVVLGAGGRDAFDSPPPGAPPPAASLAAAVLAAGTTPVLLFSSDLALGGVSDGPSSEDRAASPACPAGRDLVEAEERLLATGRGLVVRSGPLFEPPDAGTAFGRALSAMADGRADPCAAGLASPTFAPDLVHAALDLLIDDERGRWHLVSGGGRGEADLAARCAEALGLDPAPVVPQDGGAPADLRLASGRGEILPALDDAIRRALPPRPVEAVGSVAAE